MSLLNEYAKQGVMAVQEFTVLSLRAIQNILRPPHYLDDVIIQMDRIGFGSLPIVVLTGFFTGAVLALQMSATLSTLDWKSTRLNSSH